MMAPLLKRVEHVAEEMRDAYKMLVRKCDRKRPLEASKQE
jgi:hypothetical protein